MAPVSRAARPVVFWPAFTVPPAAVTRLPGGDSYCATRRIMMGFGSHRNLESAAFGHSRALWFFFLIFIRGRHIAMTKLLRHDHPHLGNMPHHRHIAPFFQTGVSSLPLAAQDRGRVKVQGHRPTQVQRRFQQLPVEGFQPSQPRP